MVRDLVFIFDIDVLWIENNHKETFVRNLLFVTLVLSHKNNLAKKTFILILST